MHFLQTKYYIRFNGEKFTGSHTILYDLTFVVCAQLFLLSVAVTFLEYWKRKNASLAHHWDCLEFEEEEERPRPEFAARCTEMEKNPVTGVLEPYFPQRSRLKRMLSGAMVILVMVGLHWLLLAKLISLYNITCDLGLFGARIGLNCCDSQIAAAR